MVNPSQRALSILANEVYARQLSYVGNV